MPHSWISQLIQIRSIGASDTSRQDISCDPRKLGVARPFSSAVPLRSGLDSNPSCSDPACRKAIYRRERRNRIGLDYGRLSDRRRAVGLRSRHHADGPGHLFPGVHVVRSSVFPGIDAGLVYPSRGKPDLGAFFVSIRRTRVVANVWGIGSRREAVQSLVGAGPS